MPRSEYDRREIGDASPGDDCRYLEVLGRNLDNFFALREGYNV